MKKYEIVKKNLEFNDIIKTGRYFKNKYYVIYYKDGIYNFPRFGLAVSTKCGCAVERNKIKRQLRFILDKYKKLCFKNKNYIIMVRSDINNLSFKEKEQYLLDVLGKMREKN